MENALPETMSLSTAVLSEDIQKRIEKFLSLLDNSTHQKIDTHDLWLIDKEIGGIGGYCMPSDPVKNPFPGGSKRELYRPLQYARSEINIYDPGIHSRYIVLYCGMHLEAVCRLFLKEGKFLSSIRYNNTTLGKSVDIIKKTKLIDDRIINGLFSFVAIYNKSKHEVNNDDNRIRLFSPCDGIIAYFSARILGLYLLKYIGIKEASSTHEICD